MSNDSRCLHNAGRRLFVLGGIGVVGTIVISARFFKLQVLEHKKYTTLADQNRIRTVFIHKPRKILIDCHGREIAGNIKVHNIICTPTEARDKPYILEWLVQLFSLSEKEKNSLENKLNGTEAFIIKTPLGWPEISILEYKSNQLQGIKIHKEYFRTYPLKMAMAHIVGYSMYDSTKKKYKGVTGLEKLYEQSLQRESDIIKNEVDSRERYKREIEHLYGKDTETHFKVSLSGRLHEFIYKLLSTAKGAVCILEIPSGTIRAIVSSPSYDNNIFSGGIISQKQWSELNSNPYKPLLNRGISATFQPASTFKPIVALAALENQIIDEKYTANCTGSMKIGNRNFRCWKKSGHGEVNLTKALSESCNVYFYKAALKLQGDSIINVAKAFGLGKQLFTNMAEERYGILPDAEWCSKYLGQPLSRGDIINLSIGHGYLSATPLQLAVVAARLGTGKIILPTFDNDAINDFPDININPKHLRMIRIGMLNTFGKSGTCKQFSSEMGEIVGKTGTAQLNNTAMSKNTQVTHNSFFIGYTNNAQGKNYAISVVLENTQHIASSFAVKALRYLKSNPL